MPYLQVGRCNRGRTAASRRGTQNSYRPKAIGGGAKTGAATPAPTCTGRARSAAVCRARPKGGFRGHEDSLREAGYGTRRQRSVGAPGPAPRRPRRGGPGRAGTRAAGAPGPAAGPQHRNSRRAAGRHGRARGVGGGREEPGPPAGPDGWASPKTPGTRSRWRLPKSEPGTIAPGGAAGLRRPNSRAGRNTQPPDGACPQVAVRAR